MSNVIDWLPGISRLGSEMARKLSLPENVVKPRPKKADLSMLHDRLEEETSELAEALYSKSYSLIISECADVASFAMMIGQIAYEKYGEHS